MFREPQPDLLFAPAMVVNRIDIGFLIKYELRFDDGVVSPCLGYLCLLQHRHTSASSACLLIPS